MLAGCAAGALSLLTWSAADPSLTHATSGATHNLLGPIGAILSDLLMQMVGLGSVFVFLPPVFWGLQLLSGETIKNVRVKLVAAPIAVILLASAFASLPQTANWPLHHNYGGILGDLSIDLAATPLLPINPDWAWAVAGLLCFAGGVFMLGMSIGLTKRDVLQMWLEAQRLGRRALSSGWRMLADFAAARREPLLAAVSSYRMPSFHIEPTFEPTLEPTLERSRGARTLRSCCSSRTSRCATPPSTARRSARAAPSPSGSRRNAAKPPPRRVELSRGADPARARAAHNRSTSGPRTASCGVRPRPGRPRS